MKLLSKIGQACSVVVVIVAASQVASAHFPWIALDTAGKPILFFGEDLSDRTYHFPESLAGFEVRQATGDQQQVIDWKAVDSDELVGLQAPKKVPAGAVLYGQQTYGIYHGAKLDYFAMLFTEGKSAEWQTPPETLDLRAQLSSERQGIAVKVFWKDKPLADAEVSLFSIAGEKRDVQKTDAQGVAKFEPTRLSVGWNALLVGFTDTDSQGTLKDKPYKSVANYLTVSFPWKGTAEVVAADYPDLPTELTSFGGTIVDGQLFLYGGHIGDAHSYSIPEQSNALWMLDLDQRSPKAEWKALPSGPRLQGLALVPDEHSVVRLGGFTALNAEGEEHDLHSQDGVSRFDLQAQKWEPLTALPEPRSSHAATVIGSQVYVVGGWNMSGEEPTVWHQTAWTADLGQSPLQWQPIAAPPFQRRALSLAAHHGKLYAVGGMAKEGGPSARMDVYDPATDSWTQGPSLQGPPMAGFGCWAQSCGGQLLVSTVSGTVQRLSDDGKSWQVIGTYQPGRFFHCMLPLTSHSLLMIGGANMSVGRFTELELVTIED